MSQLLHWPREGKMSQSHSDSAWSRMHCSRRALLQYGMASAAFWGLAPAGARAVLSGETTVAPRHTWLLDSPDVLRPVPPPPPTRAELDELLRMQALRSAVTNAAI